MCLSKIAIFAGICTTSKCVQKETHTSSGFVRHEICNKCSSKCILVCTPLGSSSKVEVGVHLWITNISFAQGTISIVFVGLPFKRNWRAFSCWRYFCAKSISESILRLFRKLNLAHIWVPKSMCSARWLPVCVPILAGEIQSWNLS